MYGPKNMTAANTQHVPDLQECIVSQPWNEQVELDPEYFLLRTEFTSIC